MTKEIIPFITITTLPSYTKTMFLMIMALFLAGGYQGEGEWALNAAQRLTSWAALCFLWGVG